MEEKKLQKSITLRILSLSFLLNVENKLYKIMRFKKRKKECHFSILQKKEVKGESEKILEIRRMRIKNREKISVFFFSLLIFNKMISEEIMIKNIDFVNSKFPFIAVLKPQKKRLKNRE
jgi:hypothetical protein